MTESFNWPDGRKTAVSLTFDDGLYSQLNLAVPLLDKFGFKATFYINLAGDYRSRLKPWREIADRGHEIGNHTLTHPCSCNFQFARTTVKCLEKMSLEDIRADIMEAHRRIREVIPNGSRTFAYPCYETAVGRGISKRSYVPIV
ncbi:MAG: polysaccharide deacetylase family protein, partial [Candidatus Bathyarchaeia archaeon]